MAKGKTRTIVLTRAIDFDNSEPGKVVYHYRVQQVTDSIAYHINDFLKPETVDSLCNHDDWRVTIK